MLTGLVVGTAAGMAIKCVCEHNETSKLKKKAKKMLNKVERYINENTPFDV